MIYPADQPSRRKDERSTRRRKAKPGTIKSQRLWPWCRRFRRRNPMDPASSKVRSCPCDPLLISSISDCQKQAQESIITIMRGGENKSVLMRTRRRVGLRRSPYCSYCRRFRFLDQPPLPQYVNAEPSYHRAQS
jgi:hypothetical protein